MTGESDILRVPRPEISWRNSIPLCGHSGGLQGELFPAICERIDRMARPPVIAPA